MVDKIYNLITASGTSQPTYIGDAPIAIDDCQWIRVTGGTTDLHFEKGNFDKPIITIGVRDTFNANASSRAYILFKKLRNYVDASSQLIAVRLPTFVGKDDKHRSIYSFQLEYQTGGY